ncbi:helix-turn-helix domain-containing protein [Tsukamurella sp. PLM1]|uniref:helix-turn-helix domain-containing protein n=1 Tax=Tsukamurella sp. PLM1 TaxID=2929795 RepID=UPI0020BFF773|nr:helix-turn-helix transcriptional regulator [Tsukamurella sp. PLM1]
MQGCGGATPKGHAVVSRAIQTVWVARRRWSTDDNRSVPVPESSLSSAQRRVRRVRRDAVGEALRRARLSSGLSQEGLARLSGVSRAAIARIETGEASTQVDRLWDLAAALDTTPSAILAQAEGLL